LQAGGGTAPGVGVRLAAKDEFANHWTLVLACFVGFSFYSVMTASLSMFIKPLADEFGWSRTLIASGVSISALVTAILSPFVGALIDRLGARRLAIPGIVANMGAMCLFALATESGTVWLALWAFYSVISIATKSTIWLFAVSRVFEAGRGLALGLVLCGTAAALAISPRVSVACQWAPARPWPSWARARAGASRAAGVMRCLMGMGGWFRGWAGAP